MLNLKDGKIVDIQVDKDMSRGCDTCNFGSEYIREIYILMEDEEGKDLTLEVRIKKEYEYSEYSYGALMKFFLNNVEQIEKSTLKEFEDLIAKDVKKNDKNNIENYYDDEDDVDLDRIKRYGYNRNEDQVYCYWHNRHIIPDSYLY